MPDLDELARRAVASFTRLADKGVSFATKLFFVSLVVCGLSFYLGLQALDEGMRTVWIALGGFFGLVAVGGPLVARWRLASVRRHSGQLVTEVRSLLDRDAGARTVIETVETDARRADATTGERSQSTALIVSSRQFSSLREVAGGSRLLAEAITAVTSFPMLVLAAIPIMFVFACCALVFALALAL